MKSTYTEAFVEQALVKSFSRGDRTIQSVADDLSVNYHTLKNWMKRKTKDDSGGLVNKEKRPQDWRAEEQLVALHESHGLSGEALHAWCRERGLFAHHLTGWTAAFCVDGKGVAPGGREIRTLKEENEQLKRMLLRKDKALAEAAALLILQKKFRALWEDAGT
jgi:transposase-like protein